VPGPDWAKRGHDSASKAVLNTRFAGLGPGHAPTRHSPLDGNLMPVRARLCPRFVHPPHALSKVACGFSMLQPTLTSLLPDNWAVSDFCTSRAIYDILLQPNRVKSAPGGLPSGTYARGHKPWVGPSHKLLGLAIHNLTVLWYRTHSLWCCGTTSFDEVAGNFNWGD